MNRNFLPAILIIAALAPGSSRSMHRLEVVSRGRTIWSAAIGEGEAFSVAYTHSRELSRWIQHYCVRAGNLRQTGSAFAAYGAGMPLGRTPAVQTPEGFLVPVDQGFDELRMMNWRAASIELQYRGEQLSMSQWFEDFDTFSVRVR